MKFSKEMVKMLELFAQHKGLRLMYYVGIGAIYLLGMPALLHAIRAYFY